MQSSPAPAEGHLERFVLELLRTSSMLSGLVDELVDILPADAYPGEDPVDVVVEMLYGTMATALSSVEPQDLQRAAELIDLAGTRVLEHIRMACALSHWIDRDEIAGSDG